MASQLGHNDAVSNKVDGEKDTRGCSLTSTRVPWQCACTCIHGDF